jgi:apolipoprotein D and lipocalin family protein
MRTPLVVAAILGAVVPAMATDPPEDPAPPVTTVESVDLQRYAGLWYEIARIPNRFQKQCVRGTTAEYLVRDAKVVDTDSYAKLRVSFVSFLGWRPFWGDYWIIGLDDDYQWAAVGTPDRGYGWILARAPELPDDTLDRIFAVFERNGYERTAFETSLSGP